MNKEKFMKLNIMILVGLIFLLFSITVVLTQAKFTTEVTLDNNAIVSLTDYGFKYSVSNGECYVTSFTAEFDSNDNLLEYNPSDPSLGSLLNTPNGWTLTFPTSYTQSGVIYGNLIVKGSSSTSYGFPIYNLSGSLSLVDRKYNNLTIENIVIPNGVSVLNNLAFYKYTALKSVALNGDVVSVNSKAFYGCTSLTSITLPDSVTLLGGSAFYGCTSLASVTLSSGLSAISTSAFYKCTQLSTVTVPSSVTSIGTKAFAYCSSLSSVYIPDSVTEIAASSTSSSPFYGCSSSAKIYCEAASKPSGFGRYWNYYSNKKALTVYYGVTM